MFISPSTVLALFRSHDDGAGIVGLYLLDDPMQLQFTSPLCCELALALSKMVLLSVERCGGRGLNIKFDVQLHST